MANHHHSHRLGFPMWVFKKGKNRCSTSKNLVLFKHAILAKDPKIKLFFLLYAKRVSQSQAASNITSKVRIDMFNMYSTLQKNIFTSEYTFLNTYVLY